MIALPIGELQVDSDLQLEVDGVGARVLADGGQLTVSTRDAGLFLARVLDTLPPRGLLRGDLAQVAGSLDSAGLSARLTDDRGTVVELGRGCHSSLARVLLGTDRVRLGPRSLPVAGTVARGSQLVQRRLGVAAGGAVVAALVVLAGIRRRSLLRGMP